MTKQNPQQVKPDEVANNADKVSKTQPSAAERKDNNPQSNNTAEENKPDPEQQTKSASIDASQMDVAQIFQAMQSIWKKPSELSDQRENVKVRTDLVVETIGKLRGANKPTLLLIKESARLVQLHQLSLLMNVS